ncbi:MAG: hypothetical protein IPM24_25080 [Bryobacterales bacterium]|nr:hypothetical protein [Bryobacterales bacterium]
MTPLEFLETLWGAKSEHLQILIWTLADKKTHRFRDAASAATFVQQCRDSDVYVGVGLAGADGGPDRRGGSAEVAGIAGLWADFDLRSDAHREKPLPATVDQALSLIPESMPPTILVHTGNGLHGWWLFTEPYVFDDDADRQATAALSMRWQTFLQRRSASHGWHFDRLGDLARVLRIPGTENHKDPANPKAVTVHSTTDRRYNLSDFDEFLDAWEIPGPDEAEAGAREWKARFTEQPLVIDSRAQIPEATLNAWMAGDDRFKRTWYRQRDDLQDNSQSGYDMALANFGVRAGLDDQQIVNLVIHHRRQAGQKPRTRLDYFQRLIHKARSSSPPRDQYVCPSSSSLPGGPASGDGPAPAIDCPQSQTSLIGEESLSKALICEYISSALGVRIYQVIKYTGHDPTFHMVLETGRIEFSSVGKLMSQNQFRQQLAAHAGILIPKFKPQKWDQLVQMMLDAATIESGGDETDWGGSTRQYLEAYLTETTFLESLDGKSGHDRFWPVVHEGQIAVNANHLLMHINKTTLQNLSVKEVVSRLGAIGARNERLRGRFFKEQRRWLLPVDQFKPAEYLPPKEDRSGE